MSSIFSGSLAAQATAALQVIVLPSDISVITEFQPVGFAGDCWSRVRSEVGCSVGCAQFSPRDSKGKEKSENIEIIQKIPQFFAITANEMGDQRNQMIKGSPSQYVKLNIGGEWRLCEQRPAD